MNPLRSLSALAPRTLVPRTLGLVAAAICLVAVAAPAQSQPDDQITEYVNQWMAVNRVPGAAVALIDGPEVSVVVAGVDGDGTPITEQTAFLVGSVAKTFTSTMVLRLVDEGVIALDDNVSAYLESYPHGDVTVRALLTHTAGYTAADGMAVSERYDNTPGALQRAVADLERSGTPGQYAYTSADYAVLGALIESVTGESYGAHLERSLLSPLGMSDSGGTAQAAADLPPGHRLWFGQPRAYDAGFDESGAPYGYLVSTVDDLAIYAQAHLERSLIPGEFTDSAWDIQNSTGPDRGYGYGWSIAEVDGVRQVGHRGATPGYFADLLLVPSEDKAVVVLANSYAEANAPSLAGASEDLYRIMTAADGDAGTALTVREGDPFLGTAPWAVAGIAILGAALAAVALRRPARRRNRLLSGAAALAFTAILAVAPILIGYTARTLWIWTPDIAVSLVAAVLTWLTAAAIFLTRRPSRGEVSGRAADGAATAHAMPSR